MKHHLILRVVTKMLIPPILLFALYVQFHGDFGPGGGFQAGVIFASAFILYAIVFGLAPSIRSRTLKFSIFPVANQAPPASRVATRRSSQFGDSSTSLFTSATYSPRAD